MKSALYLLLVTTLTFSLVACNRSSNEPVSANSERVASEPAPAVAAPAAPVRRIPAPAPSISPRRADRPAPVAKPYDTVLAPRAMATIPSGTAVTIVLDQGVGSDNNKEGDTFTGSLADPININGAILAERGSHVAGRVIRVDEPGKVKGKARIELELNQITVSGKNYKIGTEPFIAVAADNKDRDAAMIAGGAGVGAIIGGITKGKKGAALGAIIGGGTGTTAVLMTKGADVRIEPETKVNFVLKDFLSVPVVRPNS